VGAACLKEKQPAKRPKLSATAQTDDNLAPARLVSECFIFIC
jgi:hypothetical protein